MTLLQVDLTFVRILSLVVLVSSLQQVYCQNNDSRIPLYFSYITSKTGDYVAGGAIPAVDLALEQINNSSSILPNYTLEYTEILDSNVSSVCYEHACAGFRFSIQIALQLPVILAIGILNYSIKII